MGVTGGHIEEGAAALAQFTGGSVVTEMITATAVVAVAVAVMTTVVVVAVAVAVAAGVEAAGMKGTMMEGGAGMVAAPLPGVQEAQSGRTARNAGLRLSSGTAKGRKSKGESLQGG